MEPYRVLTFDTSNTGNAEVYSAMLSKDNINGTGHIIYIIKKIPKVPFVGQTYEDFNNYWTDVAYSVTSKNNSEIVGRYIPDMNFRTRKYSLWDTSKCCWVAEDLRTLRLALESAMKDYCYRQGLSISKVL